MSFVMTPRGPLPADKVYEIFDNVGFDPPPGMPLQEAFETMLMLVQRQMAQSSLQSTPARGRTAVTPEPEEVTKVLEAFGASIVPLTPLGVEVKGVDTTQRLAPDLAGALERLMADHGYILFRQQGMHQNEKGIPGRYLTGAEQCELSLAFGKGELNSTHGNHEECPNRDIFRLSNDPAHGFNEVGPEWHNDGSFCRDVFSYVVYHIIKAPDGPGNTCFVHLGKAYDALTEEQQNRWRKCASINSNTGVVHPLVHKHPVSGRDSLYLHLGMTGSIIERVSDPTSESKLSGIKAWNREEMDKFFQDINELYDRQDLSVSHKWEQGDVIVIDNLAVSHKASSGAFQAHNGLRILHRTTCAGMGPLDPSPTLKFPISFDTERACPFTDKDAVWVNGYVGFRWGAWKTRATPH